MVFKVLFLSFVGLVFVGCNGSTTSVVPSLGATEVALPKMSNPYELEKSEELIVLTNYLIKKSMEVSKPVFPPEPNKPTVPHAKELVKGKYEKTADFEARVADERAKRAKELKTLETRYAQEVKTYNERVKTLTDNYNNEVATKQKNIKALTLASMQEAYAAVYGTPFVENDLKYDADSERFYANIASTKGGFNEKVAIDVPLNEAQDFERNAKYLDTEVVFDYENDKLVLKKIDVKHANKTYIAMLSDVNFKSENISVAINEGNLNLPAVPLLSTSLALNESAYNIGSVNYSTDPEIAKLQKQKFELENKNRQMTSSVKKEAELKQQKEALEAQIALLEQKSGGVDDIGSLLQNAKQSQEDASKWLFIIAIENYEYTDPVAYSANSAKQFRAVMQKRLGILEKNTRMLVNKEATSGKISYNLQDMLAHVKSGDTIYFYYSGHGIPVPTQKNEPYLLAQDMSPQYVANDEKFKLENIYMSLSSSKASKIVAFVDSCFSGGNDNQALMKGVAATRMVPRDVSFDKTKMLVLSAGSGIQYSNKYDEKSNRLFSYFLMKGIINNNENTSRLYDYVKSNVQEKSYEMGASYEQVPVYNGNIALKL